MSVHFSKKKKTMKKDTMKSTIIHVFVLFFLQREMIRLILYIKDNLLISTIHLVELTGNQRVTRAKDSWKRVNISVEL